MEGLFPGKPGCGAHGVVPRTAADRFSAAAQIKSLAVSARRPPPCAAATARRRQLIWNGFN